MIGEVTDSHSFRIFNDGELIGELPVPLLVDDCPLYDLEPEPPTVPLYVGGEQQVATEADPATILRALLASANIASRRVVFEQYDPVVQSRTVRRPEQADAAVLALPVLSATAGAGGAPIPAIAVSIDGNGRRVAVDPRAGAAEVVYECAANLACVGAEPLGLTNCLNFGNPEKPHVAWQLSEAIDGLAQACRDLEVPVVGGNVSLYNESPDGPILPTPVIGMVGKLPDARRAGRIGFLNPGDKIALVGELQPVTRRLRDCEVARQRARWRTACQGRFSDPPRPCAGPRGRPREGLRERARHRRGRDRGGAGRVLHRRRRRRGDQVAGGAGPVR